MQVLFKKARESYDKEIIVKLENNNLEDIESNVHRIEIWIGSWRHDHIKKLLCEDHLSKFPQKNFTAASTVAKSKTNLLFLPKPKIYERVYFSYKVSSWRMYCPYTQK